MTSKEALSDLFFLAIGDEKHTKKCKETIEKDLKVLEIIKKWSFIQENYKDGYGPFTQFLCNIHTIGMKEDFEKVKEWLEDDK